ncbi:hypothetical protein Ocin01_06644, partial [Orchesella cincta]
HVFHISIAYTAVSTKKQEQVHYLWNQWAQTFTTHRKFVVQHHRHQQSILVFYLLDETLFSTRFTNGQYNARCKIIVDVKSPTDQWYEGEFVPTTNFEIRNPNQTYTIRRQQNCTPLATTSVPRFHYEIPRSNPFAQLGSDFGSSTPCALCNYQCCRCCPRMCSTPHDHPLNCFGVAPLASSTPSRNNYSGNTLPFGGQFNDYSSNSGQFGSDVPVPFFSRSTNMPACIYLSVSYYEDR